MKTDLPDVLVSLPPETVSGELRKLQMLVDYQEEKERIAKRIKELRCQRGLTVQELAYLCEMERSNLSRIESGRTNPTVRTLCTLCNALGVELEALFR